MSLIQQLTDTLSTQISQLAPITLDVPTSPVLQVSQFIHHVTTTPIHPVYFPYLRFGVIHAVRVTTVWASLTKGKKRDGDGNGRLADLFGYLVLAWGGSTVTTMILNQPPSWLISPTPWIIYPVVYTLLIPTGLSRYFVDTCPAILFNLLGACVDGMTRGTTITSLGSLISSSSLDGGQNDLNLWTYVLLSALAISSGGLMVGTLGLNETTWRLGTPNLLKGGILNTLDAWGASLVGVLWLILTRQSSTLTPLSDLVESPLPREFKVSSAEGKGQVVDVAHARAICVIVLASLLATKAIILEVSSTGNPKKKVNKVDKKTELFILDADEDVNEKSSSPPKSKTIKSPVSTRTREGSSKPTPRKSPRAKSKQQ
ncbi:uncharacterized protein I303_101861 [Kwoniella dejecticola CBS 10117]|uniref:Uncharacterized protein n=1 Tax=Kwoniella dejecticola CBS 10117 TaxID=1296121 RepID=A0A1A6ACL0_9TREE|nr:uncharacterized protein I303_02003 [Kwoniella dejecticola CBS 10117]OBR87790.1 hypothetical protein I303_02003 [Kwoniella dejecticola CBS 10117]